MERNETGKIQGIPAAVREEGAPQAASHPTDASVLNDVRATPLQEGYTPPQGNPADAAAAGGTAARAPQIGAVPSPAGSIDSAVWAAGEAARARRRESRRRKLIAAAILLGAALLLLAVSLLTPVGPMLGVPAILLAVGGVIVLLCVGVGWLSERMSVWPIAALLFDLGFVLFVVVGGALTLTVVGAVLGLPLLLAGLLCPVAGIVTGVVALCDGKRRNGRLGTALAIIAIALPFVIVGTVVLLLSTGVIRVSLM